MAALLASSLLALPVRVDGILVGHVLDLIIDTALERVLGLEVECGDGEHRFLPFAAAKPSHGAVAAQTALALLDRPQLEFYARRGTSLRALRGATARLVERAEQVDDLEIGADAAIRRVVVRSGAGRLGVSDSNGRA